MPYTPEPHIWGKLKWIFTGAEGMQPVDWFDFFLHGSPWVLLFYFAYQKALKKIIKRA